LRFISFFFSSVLLLCTPALAERAQFPVHFSQSVALTDGMGTCSGVVIKPGYVLTAAHCPHKYGAMVTIAGEIEPFDVVFSGTPGTATDFAILKGDTHGLRGIPYLKKTPSFPLPAYYISRRSGHQALIPVVVTRRGEAGLVMTSATLPGDSGAPLMTGDGDLIGVVWGMYAGKLPFQEGYAVAIETIAPVLDSLK
jgi:S1-C subfamily serine protease